MGRFLKFLGCALALGAILFTSCKKEKEEFTLTVTSSDVNKGIVTGGGVYEEGSQAIIKAVAESGFHFTKWDDNNTDNPRTVIVNKNMSFTAIFAAGEGGNGGNGGDITDINDAMTLSGTMNENKTLKDLGLPIDYIIDGTFYVEGNACLTIEPGVTIAFTGTNGIIEVGENAGLKMVGTAEKPIVFQGPINNPSKGSWGYIQYASNRADNQMEYVILKNGGSNEEKDSGVLRTYGDGSVSVKNCTIDGGLGCGFSTTYGGAKNLKAFENNTIKNMDGYAMSMTKMNANALGKGNKFENNKENLIVFGWGDDVLEDDKLTLNAMGAPYFFDALYVEGELTVNEGVSMVFKKNSGFHISSGATIKLQGTEAAPIVISGLENKAGYWEGVEFKSDNSENIFKNVVISDGNERCLIVDYYDEQYLAVENLTIKNAKEYGLIVKTNTSEEEVDGEWVYSRDWSNVFKGGISGLKFENCGKGNIFDNNVLPDETEGVDNVFVAMP